MKKHFSLILAMVMAFTMLCVPTQAMAEPQSGQASAKGFGGEVTVTVTVEDGKIVDVVADGPGETFNVGQAALPLLAQAMIDAQSAEVDAVAGATFTSGAFRMAAAQALADVQGEAIEAVPLSMTAGTYTKEVMGFDQWTLVEVTTSEDAIVDIKIDHRAVDTAFPPTLNASDHVIGCVEELLPGRIIAAQSLAVDAITGATVTSNAALGAIKDCLLEAGAQETALYAPIAKSDAVETYTCEAVVVGAGSSGSTAAASLAELGIDTIVCEAGARFGGTAVLAGGMLAMGSHLSNQETIQADNDAFFNDWMRMNRYLVREPELLREYIDQSGPTLDWLTEQGFSFEPPARFGSPAHASHDFETYSVYTGSKALTLKYFNAMMEKFAANGGRALLETTVTGYLYAEDGTIAGVVAEKYDGTRVEVKADAIIFAAGGFGGSPELLTEFAGYPYQLCGFAQNDGITLKLGLEAGAATCNTGMLLAHVQRPSKMLTGFDAFDNNIPFALLYTPSLMFVNREGERFQAEDQGLTCTVDFMNGKIAQGDYYYALLTQEMVDKLAVEGPNGIGCNIKPDKVRYYGTCVEPDAVMTNIQNVFDEAVRQGVIFKGDTIEELAAVTGMKADVLAAQIAKYNGYCADGYDKMYGKDAQFLYPLSDGPYYAIKGGPTMYVTTGSVDIDSNFMLRRPDGTPIEGLFAVGVDSMGVILDGSSYPDYGGPANGWAFTSGHMVAGKVAEYLGK